MCGSESSRHCTRENQTQSARLGSHIGCKENEDVCRKWSLRSVICFTSLAVPPVITSDIRMYTVALDASVTLQCHSEGFPTPSITWYKDGQPLSESVHQRVLSTGALQITFSQPGDTGRYTCTAANVAGTTSLEMSLTVHSESVGC